MIEKIIKVLEEVVDRKSRMCDGYSKSDDIGACYHGQVHPVKEMIKFLEEMEKKDE